MALNITINKVAVADSFTAGSKVADIVVSGGTSPYSYSLASGGDYFQISGTEIQVKADMNIEDIQSFSVTATDSTSGAALTETSRTIYPNIQASIKSRFNSSNKTYKITQDINLGHGVLVLPTDCTLDFQGGSFSNGVIKISSHNKLYLNGSTLINCTLDLGDNDRVVNNVYIGGGKLYISGDLIGIRGLGNPSHTLFSQDIHIENLEIQGDLSTSDIESPPTEKGCIGICIQNSWMWYFNKVIVTLCDVGAYILGNNLSFSQCSLRYCRLPLHQIGGNINTFVNGDLEVGYYDIIVEDGYITFSNSYIESHTAARGVVLNGGKLVMNNNYINGVLFAINEESTLHLYNNYIYEPGITNSNWNLITVLNDVKISLTLKENIVKETTYLYTLTPFYQMSYWTGSNFERLSSTGVIDINSTNIQIRNRGTLSKISLTNSSTSKIESLNVKTYNGVSVITGDSSVTDNIPQGTLGFNNNETAKPNLLYKDTGGKVSSVNIPWGAKGSKPNYPSVNSSLFNEDGELCWWGGTKWENISFIRRGVTSARPILLESDAGIDYYDSTLKKKILWNGTAWVNVDGTPLEESTALNSIEEVPANQDTTY